jgi:Big-like domain-containing protein
VTFENPGRTRRQQRQFGLAQRGRSLHLESLESRILLDADGFLTGTDVHLTLGFAADGTDIAGQASSLAATFDAIAPTAVWQEAILRAFQAWASQTNGDIGVTGDSGDPFGSPGPSQKDERFGDIRIGAIAMSAEVGAVSVPVDGIVSGTWFADVVFNSNFDYQTLDDIYAVALHEAGNVLGLEDNSDPTSPLFTGGIPTGLPPTATDIADLHQLHGARLPDINEPVNGQTDNDSFANATRLELLDMEGAIEGSAPSIVYGDITSDLDRDFFRLITPGNYSGRMTVQLRSSGISLLSPTLSIYSDSQQLLMQTLSTSTSGDTLTLPIPAVTPDQTYYLEVGGAVPGLFGIGGYSLVATFDGINQISQAAIDSIAGGQFRFLDQKEFEEFFNADDDDLLGDDLHTNDTSLTATSLETTVGFLKSNRYEVVGSIADETDVDFYQFESPEITTLPLDVLTVLVRSLDAGGLVPQTSLFDSHGLPVPFTIIANGGGDYIIQADGVTAGDDYEIKIEAQNAAGPFNTGNYNLAITFSGQAIQFTPMSAGSVGNGTTQNIHTLFVGQPQLFHFALAVETASVTAPTAVVATIKNDLGESVYQIAAQPGQTRSREAVLLAPGTYTIVVIPYSLDGNALPTLSYTLLGTSISDPFVGDANNPNTHPFACTEPGMEGFFCYPGDFISPDPFLWDSFIDSLNTPPEALDLPTLISTILGDWWTWVWAQAGVNGPPLAVSDAIQVQSTSASLAAAAQLLGTNGSILDNDIDPEGDTMVAILRSSPENGTLSIESNGTFYYAPNPGFQGRDAFTYTAYDFIQESAPTTVTIIVGESGDFDTNGNTDGGDFLTWQRNFGTLSGASLTEGDSNFDRTVDVQDLTIWGNTFGTSAVQPSADFNSDGVTSGTDFLIWQRNFGTLSGAARTDGDSNSDGDVDSQDLYFWQIARGTSAVAATSAMVAVQPIAISVAPSVATERALLSTSASSPPAKGQHPPAIPYFIELPSNSSISKNDNAASQALQSWTPGFSSLIDSDSYDLLSLPARRHQKESRMELGQFHDNLHHNSLRDDALAEYARGNFHGIRGKFIDDLTDIYIALGID